jgi:hypothetical protein
MSKRLAIAVFSLSVAAISAQSGGVKLLAAELFVASSRTLVAPLAYEEPGMFDARVYRFEYKPGLFADIYRPDGAAENLALPLVLCTSPYSKAKSIERHGKGFIDTSAVVSWSAFLAGGGMAVAAPEISSEAARDLDDFAAVLRNRAPELGVDPERIVLFGSSAGAPQAWRLAQSASPLAGKVRSIAPGSRRQGALRDREQGLSFVPADPARPRRLDEETGRRRHRDRIRRRLSRIRRIAARRRDDEDSPRREGFPPRVAGVKSAITDPVAQDCHESARRSARYRGGWSEGGQRRLTRR